MRAILMFAVIVGAVGCDGSRRAAVEADVALVDVTVVDVAEGRLVPNQTVLIDGNRILAVAPSGETRVPASASTVSARGKYVIPGLVDMHVHLFNQISQRSPNSWYFPLLVANGVSGVREMWTKRSDLPTIATWRDGVTDGALLAPRVLAVGALVDGPSSWYPTTDRVTTADEAVRFVRETAAAAFDFVKVYSSLSRESYFAVTAEARRVGLPVAGHVPLTVTAREAAAAGQRSNEHLQQVREACSTVEQQVLREREALYSRRFTAAEDDALWERHERLRTDAFDLTRCQDLARRLSAAPVWQVPTLVNERRYFLGPPAESESDPRLVFVPAEERRVWAAGLHQFGVEITLASQARAAERERRFAASLRVVRELHAGGVPFMAGTDLGGPYLFPGFSLHEELALLVEAGLSPMEALRAATINPARFLRLTDSLGTIAPGQLADLVLLDDDPLRAIDNTRKIAAVVLNGRYLDRRALNELLEAAKSSARR